MARMTQIKNMMIEFNSLFEEVLTGALKEKYAQKVLAALMEDKVQAAFAQVIDDKMPKTSRKKNRKKDPEAPKKNCSSYIFFCKDARADIKAEHKDWKGKEVTSELGRIWREELSDEDKTLYIEKAVQDKERYLEEMKDYTPSSEWLASISSDSESSGGKNKRVKKKRKGPKRAMSAYLYFCKDMRQTVKDNNEGFSAKEVTAELGRIWREEVKDDKKASKKYRKQAKADKARYEEEKASWVDPDPSSDDENEEAVPRVEKTSNKKSSRKKAVALEMESESDN